MQIEQLIEILSEKFELVIDKELGYISIDGYGFVIECGREGTFSIYRVFSYPVVTNMENSIGTMFEELQFIQNLYRASNKVPEDNYEISMGCPYDDVKVGFFDCQFDDKIIDIVSQFIVCEEENADLDFSILNKIVPDKVRCYFEECKKENDKLDYLTHMGWKVFEEHSIDEMGVVYKSYINENGTILTGTDEILLNNILDKIKMKEICDVSIYIGIKYAIATAADSSGIWNSAYINDILVQINKMGLYDYDVEYKMTDRGLLIIRCGYYWALVAPINVELEQVVHQEKSRIESMLEKLQSYLPENDEMYRKIDFSCIDASQFERLCKELLSEMGFKRIFSRGKTNAPDGGVDIECDEEVKQIFGTKERHWIFQCKHMKSQIDRKDISEISDLLKEFNAEGYGIFYSGIFSAQTLDRLKSKIQDNRFEIQYWDEHELSSTIRKYDKVYKLYLDMINDKGK